FDQPLHSARLAPPMKITEIRAPTVRDRQGGADRAECLNRFLTVAAPCNIFKRCGAALGGMGNSPESAPASPDSLKPPEMTTAALTPATTHSRTTSHRRAGVTITAR